MDRITQYREIIERVLTETWDYLKTGAASGMEVEYKLLFDRERDSYGLLMVGFGRAHRIHNLMIHLEIINGKVWLQADNTDLEIARELEKAGIRKDEIVLGFHQAKVRPYTEYAAA